MSSEVTWDEVRGRAVRVPAHVVSRAMATETVLLNIESGTYHSLDAVAGRFVEVLAATATADAAANLLATEYGQPLGVIREDLLAFVGTMLERGLLVLEPA